MNEDFKLAGVAGHYELLLPRAATPDLVLSAFPAKPDPRLLERYGARRVFRLRFPPDGQDVIARIALHDLENEVDILDTTPSGPEHQIIALTPEGVQILGEPSAELLDPRRTPEVLLLLPQFRPPKPSTPLLFRAYDSSGRIVARLLPQIER